VDIRLKGSHNIGATNVTRQIGVMAGLLTLAGDLLKGALPVYPALVAFGPIKSVGGLCAFYFYPASRQSKAAYRWNGAQI